MIKRGGRRRRFSAVSDIPLTPLIDTALTLLIIFMVMSPMVHNAIRVSLPKSSVKEVEVHEPAAMTVFIDEQQRIFFDGRECAVSDLADLLRAGITQKDKNKDQIFVRADEKVPYGRVIELIDHIKHVEGISRVVLVTQKLV